MTGLTELPLIVISKADYERLNKVAEAARHTVPEVAEQLSRELDRSAIPTSTAERATRVRMGSHVEYRDNESGRVRAIQLVYPAEADPHGGRISILTPIGTALIGLSERQTMPWPGRSGERRTLTVLKVATHDEPIRYTDM